MMHLLLIAILGSTAAFLFAISLMPSENPVSRALAELEAHGTTATRDSATTRRFERFFSASRRSRLERKLVEAGWYTVTPGRMALRMLGCAIGGFAVSMLLVPMFSMPASAAIVIGLLCGLAGMYLPLGALDKAIEKRKTQVQKTLPDFLDMVAETVQAGLSVNAALAHAIGAAPGALGDEIKSALSEMRLGRSRADALKAAADRLSHEQFSTTVTAIVQAERLGTNISRVLSELAEDVRNHRIMLAEEHAAKLPIKMVAPLALFLLPALFVCIFGSLIANYFAQQP